MSSPPVPQRPGRRLKLVGMLLMVLGVAIAALAAAPIVRTLSDSFVDALTGPVYTAPFDEFVQLDRGKYLLLESETSSAQVSPDSVRVADLAGGTLSSLRQSSGNNTVDRDGERFVDVIEFTAAHSGRYRIDVIYPPQARLIVGRDPVDAFGSVANWFAVGGIGAVTLLLGFTLLLLGFSRGRPAARAPVLVYYGQQPWAPPPPGWYPDPQRPGGWRYWDGYRWQP